MVIELSPASHGPHKWYVARMFSRQGSFMDFLRLKGPNPNPGPRNLKCGPNEYIFSEVDLPLHEPAEILLRLRLSQLPMYNHEQKVQAVRITTREGDPIGLAVEWTPKPRWREDSWSTHVSINIFGDMCYLLSVGLDEKLRGQGLGRQLYAAVEGFARDMGCRRLELTASGWTYRGKDDSRADYMVRLGYSKFREDDIVVYKDL